MWRSESLSDTLFTYRSSFSSVTSSEQKSFSERISEFMDHPDCETVLKDMKKFLEMYVGKARMDIRCDEHLEELYESLNINPSNLKFIKCLKSLPLEWQSIILTHAQHARGFCRQKQIQKPFEDIDTIIPTTLNVVQTLIQNDYWKEMMQLSINYAYGDDILPDMRDLRKTTPIVKGLEAILRIVGAESSSSSSSSQDICRTQLRLMRNLKPVPVSVLPKMKFSNPLRVYSDQHISSSNHSYQAALENFVEDDAFKQDLKWDCGFIWCHTYPFWMWEHGSVRLDIRIPANVSFMYTPFYETQLFTSIDNTAMHLTLMLPPGQFKVTDKKLVPRPNLHSSGEAFQKDKFVHVIFCEYSPLSDTSAE